MKTPQQIKNEVEKGKKIVFRTLMKRQQRMLSPRTIKFISRGLILLSRDLRVLFKGKEYIEVLIDEDYNKIAFKPSNDAIRGYKLSNCGTFQCGPLKKGELVGEYPVRFTEGKIIIDNIDVKKMESMEYWDD